MGYYLLEACLTPCTEQALHDRTDRQYVAVLTTPEWERERERFDMGIDLEPDAGNIHNSKAEVNYDSLTGTFQIPDRTQLRENDFCFAFALDEKGIVFIDEMDANVVVVDESDIADVVSSISGVPVSNLTEGEASKLLRCEDAATELSEALAESYDGQGASRDYTRGGEEHERSGKAARLRARSRIERYFVRTSCKYACLNAYGLLRVCECFFAQRRSVSRPE